MSMTWQFDDTGMSDSGIEPSTHAQLSNEAKTNTHLR